MPREHIFSLLVYQNGVVLYEVSFKSSPNMNSNTRIRMLYFRNFENLTSLEIYFFSNISVRIEFASYIASSPL